MNFIFFCFCPRLCVLVVLIMIAVVLRFHVNLLRPNAFWNTVCSNFPFVFLCISYSWLFFNFLLNEVKNNINEISPCKWISSSCIQLWKSSQKRLHINFHFSNILQRGSWALMSFRSSYAAITKYQVHREMILCVFLGSWENTTKSTQIIPFPKSSTSVIWWHKNGNVFNSSWHD